MDKNIFEKALEKDLMRKYDTTVENALDWQLHECVSSVFMELIAQNHSASLEKHLSTRRAMYLSMEFLMGRAVHNNLMCAGIYETAEEILNAHGRSLDDLETIEDAALGNGGLGRLAACFLDSAAAHDLPLDGYGIRYKYGLFRQTIENGFQREYADDWQKYGDPWSRRSEQDSVLVRYADQTVRAVPYDMPVIGYGTNNIGNLRLWQAEAVGGFDFNKFNDGDYSKAGKGKDTMPRTSQRCSTPTTTFDEGKVLRLRQEYFFSAASLADALAKSTRQSFGTLDKLYKYVTVQLNDTHPVISIPELMSILVDENGYDFEKAFEITEKTFNYTNHTVMQEALEKWRSTAGRESCCRSVRIHRL